MFIRYGEEEPSSALDLHGGKYGISIIQAADQLSSHPVRLDRYLPPRWAQIVLRVSAEASRLNLRSPPLRIGRINIASGIVRTITPCL